MPQGMSTSACRPKTIAGAPAPVWILLFLVILVSLPNGGCATARMERMEGKIDTLGLSIDSLKVNQAIAMQQLQEAVAQQEDLLHSLRAGSNVASQDMVDRIEELSAKLDDTAERLARTSRRTDLAVAAGVGVVVGAAGAGADSAGVVPPPGVDAQTMYELAARDFTQGRFELALDEFRMLIAAYPTHELADNAMYGVGESFYALASYDSAEVAYKDVQSQYPDGDKVPASLYKLGMTYQKMGQTQDAKETFSRLSQEYPRSGEATLAEERISELDRL